MAVLETQEALFEKASQDAKGLSPDAEGLAMNSIHLMEGFPGPGAGA